MPQVQHEPGEKNRLTQGSRSKQVVTTASWKEIAMFMQLIDAVVVV